MEIFQLQFLDYVAFLGYFVVLSGIGFWYGKAKAEHTSDYFLAGKSLPWYVVGSSYIAANISTEHFIGLIGAAVIYGICVATGEWSTVLAFTFLIWIFVPYLLSSKVLTTPEYLEKRFNKKIRLLFAVVSILANVFAFMGPVIYGGSLILIEFYEMSPVLACIIIGVSTGGFAIWGGLKSVAFMDVLTILIMVIGGLSVTLFGLQYLGDGNGLLAGINKMIAVNSGGDSWSSNWINEQVPNILKGAKPGTDYNRLSVLQPINHYSNPWTHWVFSFFYIGLWYTVINQTMIQKVFAAKNLYHARAGMVLATFLKLLLPFIVVFPGLIYFAMKPEFLTSGDWATISDEANKTYIQMIGILVPPFLKGILLAALFGAIQSTVSAVLNSTSTMLTMDIYRQYFTISAPEKHYVRFGKWVGLLLLLISIGFAALLATTKVNLFIFIQAMYTFIAPPFSALFLLGMLWKRVSGTDALITVLGSFLIAGILKYLEFGPLSESTGYWASVLKPFANQGLITWLFAMVLCSILAFLTPPPPKEHVLDHLTFHIKGEVLKAELGTKWYNSIVLWWGLAFFLLLVLIVLFSSIV